MLEHDIMTSAPNAGNAALARSRRTLVLCSHCDTNVTLRTYDNHVAEYWDSERHEWRVTKNFMPSVPVRGRAPCLPIDGDNTVAKSRNCGSPHSTSPKSADVDGKQASTVPRTGTAPGSMQVPVISA